MLQKLKQKIMSTHLHDLKGKAESQVHHVDGIDYVGHVLIY